MHGDAGSCRMLQFDFDDNTFPSKDAVFTNTTKTSFSRAECTSGRVHDAGKFENLKNTEASYKNQLACKEKPKSTLYLAFTCLQDHLACVFKRSLKRFTLISLNSFHNLG